MNLGAAQTIRLLGEAVKQFTASAKRNDDVDVLNALLQPAINFLTGAATVEDNRKRVYLGLPYVHVVELGASKAAFVYGSADKYHVTVTPQSGSATPWNFDRLLVDCINAKRYDYFVMLHSDISPHAPPACGPFIDVLIEEAEALGCEVMHAVAPIKDGLGLTSTTVGDYTSNEWQTTRRLTVTELQELPETFELRDVLKLWEGQSCPSNPALLPNTGCMVLRMGSWVRKFALDRGFAFATRIIEQQDGSLNSEFGPEDWGLGRWCANNGIKVGGTRKVKLDHIGMAAFPNTHAWGKWARDEHYLQKVKNG